MQVHKEQKDLLAAAGVIKQLISVKEALPAFIDWLQETGTDLHDGF